MCVGAPQAACQNPGRRCANAEQAALWGRGSLSASGRPRSGTGSTCRPGQGASGWGCDGVLRPSPVTCAFREKWCHMTQEERNDSLRFNENITFGQLG